MNWFLNMFKRDLYAEMTAAVNRWWDSIYKPDDFYEIVEVDLTIHICGSEEVIEKEYNKLFGTSVDYDGTAGLAHPVKHSDGRWHAFIISTEIGFVTREINPFNAGHEAIAHILDMHNEQQGARVIDYRNPDEGRK